MARVGGVTARRSSRRRRRAWWPRAAVCAPAGSCDDASVTVRIAPEVLRRFGEGRRPALIGAMHSVRAEQVSLGLCGPFTWAELVSRYSKDIVVRYAAWGANDLMAFTDPRAPSAIIAEAQPELTTDMADVLTVMALCDLPALAADDLDRFYDDQRMIVAATPRLRREFEPPHMEGAGLVYVSHRRRQGDIVRVFIDGHSFTVSCDVLGTAGTLVPALRAPR